MPQLKLTAQRAKTLRKNSPKQIVHIADPSVVLDFYELLRAQGKPCWFIRSGLQGRVLSSICNSPRAAWRNAYQHLLVATFAHIARQKKGEA